MTLLQDWEQGEASDCSSLECLTLAGGLSECQTRCMDNPDCTVINFCPYGADCPLLNRCCLRKCTGDKYMLSTRAKGWAIYVKGMSSSIFYSSTFNIILSRVIFQRNISSHFLFKN